MTYLFNATGLRKSYSGRSVVSGVNLGVKKGEIVGLLGPSGSGKSTIFQMLTGTKNVDFGRVFMAGQDITKASMEARARNGLGYVPQSPELFLQLTVEDNLKIAIEAKNYSMVGHEPFLKTIFQTFGLSNIYKHRINELSGGQRRLVEIAFAVCGRPRVLLLDEPFSGLDPIVVSKICDLLRTFSQIGIGMILTDHKVREALDVATRAYVIVDGMIIESGTKQEIVCNPRVKSLFLGNTF